MLRSQQMIVVVVVATLGGVAAEASAGQPTQDIAAERLMTTRPAAADGRIVGAVADAAGAPLEGVMVSAFGPTGSELARSDQAGRFLLGPLAPGDYLVQAHLAGFVASSLARIAVAARVSARHSITLSRVGPQVALQSVPATVGVSRPRPRLDETEAAPTVDEPHGAESTAPHDHSEKAWRLRRARRSVLKTTDAWIEGSELLTQGPRGIGRVALAARGGLSEARYTPGLADLPLSGQVNLLTRGLNLLTGEARTANIANLAVGAPGLNGDWSAKGAMTTGVVSSWVASGAYVSDSDRPHQLGVTASYGRQQYEGGNPSVLMVSSERRYAVGFGVTDVWTVSPRLSLAFGGQYATYGYIEENALFNPRLGFTVTPAEGTRVTVVASQEHVAPGAQEFLPPAHSELWLPPERTFAALSGGDLRPERTRHLDVSVEHDLTEHYVIGVRRFYQDVSDQMSTLFGVDAIGLAPTGHYDVARAGEVSSHGWVLTLRRDLGDRVTGWVDYTLAEAEWLQAGADPALATAAPGAIRPAHERFHDISGVIETEIPETDTRVSVRGRVSTAFARADLDEPIGVDARFDVRVNQALPFSPFDGSRWEVLIAVRSLFFEPRDVASLFDELLVARSPRQVVGGLVVHF